MYNILIVDDSATIRSVVAKVLKIAEVPTGNLWEAGNGREALEVLRREWVDLVFADINMPVMNGDRDDRGDEPGRPARLGPGGDRLHRGQQHPDR